MDLLFDVISLIHCFLCHKQTFITTIAFLFNRVKIKLLSPIYVQKIWWQMPVQFYSSYLGNKIQIGSKTHKFESYQNKTTMKRALQVNRVLQKDKQKNRASFG